MVVAVEEECLMTHSMHSLVVVVLVHLEVLKALEEIWIWTLEWVITTSPIHSYHTITYLLLHQCLGQGMSSFSSFSSSSSSFGGKSGKSVSTSTYIGPDGRKVTKKSTTVYKPDGSQVYTYYDSLIHVYTYLLTHLL